MEQTLVFITLAFVLILFVWGKWRYDIVALLALLGGMITLFGTPPNIIIATFRAGYVGDTFGMFDFAPVGIAFETTGSADMIANPIISISSE